MKNTFQNFYNESAIPVFLKLSIFFLLIVSGLSGCKEKSVEKEIEPEVVIKEPLKIPVDSAFISVSYEFENLLIKNKIDPDQKLNGKIRYEYIKNVDSLDISFYGLNKSLKGIEYFTNLKYLKVRGFYSTASVNQIIYYYAFSSGVVDNFVPAIDTLDVSNNLKLEYLDCSGTSDGGGYASSIRNLTLGNNSNLKTIISNSSMINSLDLNGLPALENLEVASCYNLTSLSLCKNSALVKLKSWQLKTISVPSPKTINPGWEIGSAALIQCK
ncbi:MAG: hypothetical protein ABIN24_05280 [Dyadobacter sp.]